MKKVLSVLLVLAMILSLAACGKKEEPTNSGSQTPTKSESNTNSNTDNKQ